MPFRLLRHDQKALSWEDVEALILSGELSGDSMVRRDGEREFLSLRERPEFDHLFATEAPGALRRATPKSSDRRSESSVLDTQRITHVLCMGDHPELPASRPITVDVAIDSRSFFLLNDDERLAAIPRSRVMDVDVRRDAGGFVVAVQWENDGTGAMTTCFQLAGASGQARAEELALFFRLRRLAM